MKKKIVGYNTNLASEYFVLSMLYRKGLNAYLTLGNKKSVDIVLEKNDGSVITVDVKGLEGKTNWPMDNFKKESDNHFIVLVSFLNQISNHDTNPECWIVPSKEARKLFYVNPKGNRQVISRHTIIKKAPQFRNNWDLFKG